MARRIDVSGEQFATPVTFESTVTFSPPSGSVQTQFISKRYVSQKITESALSSGATCTVALTGEPVGMVPRYCYVVTDETTTSGNGATTGLTVEIGIVGDPDFHMVSTSVFGAAGRKEAYAGVGIDGYRANDAIIAKFTAVGAGSENCSHITNLSMYVVLMYDEVAAEY